MDDGHHGFAGAVGKIQFEGPARGLGRDERIDDDQPGVTLDYREVGEVRVADLVQTVRDLEEPSLEHELRLSPQARVHSVRCGGALLDKRVFLRVPYFATVLGSDDTAIRKGSDESALGVLEVPPILEG